MTDTHQRSSIKLPGLTLKRARFGGFWVMLAPTQFNREFPIAAFSTADEALAWIKDNIARDADHIPPDGTIVCEEEVPRPTTLPIMPELPAGNKR